MTALGFAALALSSEELIQALQRAGFAVRRTGDVAILDRGMRTLSVASSPVLSPEELGASLRSAGLSYSELLEHLSR